MINVTNGTTNGGSNTITFNPRDSIELVSWVDDVGTHARLFGHNERDDALVGVPADARRASFSSAAVVELLLKQAGLTAQTIFAMIEEAHAKHPACAIILDGEQEVALRKAIRNSGGGDIVPMSAFGTAPTYTGLAMKPSCGFIAIADAPILGVWAGATLVAEHVAEQHRVPETDCAKAMRLEAKMHDARERGKLRETLLVDIIGQLRHHAGGENVPADVRVAAADALGRIGTALAAR